MCARPISEADGAHWIRACATAALERRTLVPVRVAGRHLLIVRDGSRLFATERACPHEGADLAEGRCAGGRLFCPRHRAWFDLADGAVSPGWDFARLRTYPVRLRGAAIEVRIEPGDPQPGHRGDR